MGIGLGINYVTWWEIQKWIPPTSKLPVGTRFNNSWARVVKTSVLPCFHILWFVRARCLNSVRVQQQNRKITILQETEHINEENMKSRIERSILQLDM